MLFAISVNKDSWAQRYNNFDYGKRKYFFYKLNVSWDYHLAIMNVIDSTPFHSLCIPHKHSLSPSFFEIMSLCFCASIISQTTGNLDVVVVGFLLYNISQGVLFQMNLDDNLLMMYVSIKYILPKNLWLSLPQTLYPCPCQVM